jgi:hypothetical protein
MTRKRSVNEVARKKIKQLVKFTHFKIRDLLTLEADPSAFVEHEKILETFEKTCLAEHDKEVVDSVGCVLPVNVGGELSGRK